MSNMWENIHRSVQFKHTHSNNTHRVYQNVKYVGNTLTLIVHTFKYHVRIDGTCQTCGKTFTEQLKHTHSNNTHRVYQNVIYVGKHLHFNHPYL